MVLALPLWKSTSTKALSQGIRRLVRDDERFDGQGGDWMAGRKGGRQ
jgi:hypothetical protein